MHGRILKRIQEKIRTRQNVMTLHAEEKMDDDERKEYDLRYLWKKGNKSS